MADLTDKQVRIIDAYMEFLRNWLAASDNPQEAQASIVLMAEAIKQVGAEG